MKHIAFILTAFTLLLACNSNNNKYEQTIADYVQTDRKGTKYDMKFKVLEIKEVKKITINDSILHWNERAEEQRKIRIDFLEDSKRLTNNQEIIDSANAAIWQLNKWNPYDSILNQYAKRDKEEILAIVVQCRYSAIPPMYNTKIEETKNFILSPDGTKCYRKQSNK